MPGVKRDTARSSLGDSCNKADRVNQHGGDIQQLVAEAFLQQGKAYFTADLSIQNGGGVRVDVPAGRAVLRPLRPSPVGALRVEGLLVARQPCTVEVDAAGEVVLAEGAGLDWVVERDA